MTVNALSKHQYSVNAVWDLSKVYSNRCYDDIYHSCRTSTEPDKDWQGRSLMSIVIYGDLGIIEFDIN